MNLQKVNEICGNFVLTNISLGFYFSYILKFFSELINSMPAFMFTYQKTTTPLINALSRFRFLIGIVERNAQII